MTVPSEVIPGGVSSPARAFGAVGGDPIVAWGGEGPWLIDADGNRYIDYIQGFGAVILGHADPRVTEAVSGAAARGGATGLSSAAETELARRIVRDVASVEKVRFVTSGTEASMTAARLARAATGRRLLVKFEGCYHGHADAFLAKAGSGVATFSVPMAAGVPEASVSDTLVLPYNDPVALQKAFASHPDEVAALFVEPIAANMGVVMPQPGFLEEVRRLCTEHGALCVFDEVVTGFRVGAGGAQSRFGIDPDLTMMGKVIGGGLPVGALGGPAGLMDLLAPVGPVYQAGTFAAHPHAMVAGGVVIDALGPESFEALEATTTRLAEGISEAAGRTGIRLSSARAPTFLCVFFADGAPADFASASASDTDAFARFHRALRAEGVLVPPSPYEAWFPSLAHSSAEVDQTIEAVELALAQL